MNATFSALAADAAARLLRTTLAVACLSAWAAATAQTVPAPAAPVAATAPAAAPRTAGGTSPPQERTATNGDTVMMVGSRTEPNRIRVEGAKINNVFGNVYASTCQATAPSDAPAAPAAAPTPGAIAGAQPSAAAAPAATTPAVNPQGSFIVDCDAGKGEVYILARPGRSPAPINVFVSTALGTYTVVITPQDVPAQTLVIRDPASARMAAVVSSGEAGGAAAPRQPHHVRALKSMLLAAASNPPAPDLVVVPVNREVQLWQEARFVLLRELAGRGYLVRHYTLTNVSAAELVMTEPEFDSPGVLAVSVENTSLLPGEITNVFVIRAASN